LSCQYITEIEALELLKHHDCTHGDISHTKTQKGFLGMLRPFDGQLYEDNFHELMTILTTIKQHFRSDTLDREIISSFWSICHLSKAWVLNPDSMLRRNNLLSDNQIKQLLIWVDCISYAVMGLLDGMDDEDAFELYRLYFGKNKE
jgi:hypothetical protein